MTVSNIMDAIDSFIKNLPEHFETDQYLSDIRVNIVYGLNQLSHGLHQYLNGEKDIVNYIEECKESLDRNKEIYYPDTFQDVIDYFDTAYDFIDQVIEELGIPLYLCEEE